MEIKGNREIEDEGIERFKDLIIDIKKLESKWKKVIEKKIGMIGKLMDDLKELKGFKIERKDFIEEIGEKEIGDRKIVIGKRKGEGIVEEMDIINIKEIG